MLAQVTDPRHRRGVRCRLAVILGLAVCAVLAGARSSSAIAEWAADADQDTLWGPGRCPQNQPSAGPCSGWMLTSSMIWLASGRPGTQHLAQAIGGDRGGRQDLTRAFESGGCPETEFAAGVVADWQLDLSPAAFLQAFRDWPAGPLPGAAELVAQTWASVATGCFSNTNALYWHDHIAGWPLTGLFDHRFLSFELGLLKPDTAAFAHVAGLLKVPAGRVLFLDDNAVNVAGAAAAGFQAARAAGVNEARQCLAEAAVLGTAA